jgi:hypothetical protein
VVSDDSSPLHGPDFSMCFRQFRELDVYGISRIDISTCLRIIPKKECPVAMVLFNDYSTATAEYFEAVDAMTSLFGQHDKFAAQHRTEETRKNCQRARLRLDRHRLDHSCAALAATKT